MGIWKSDLNTYMNDNALRMQGDEEKGGHSGGRGTSVITRAAEGQEAEPLPRLAAE